MASTINASTSAGLVTTADTSGVLQLQTANTTAVTLDASQNVGIGTTSPVSVAGFTILTLNNAGTGSAIYLQQASTSIGAFSVSTGGFTLGSVNNTPVTYIINGVEKTKLDTSGNFLVTGGGGLGYGAGSGGTVTQATNKSTGVTINKPTGQITMNNAALASGGVVQFTVTNSTVSATDTAIVNITSGTSSLGSYVVNPTAFANGSFAISILNRGTTSLSDALVLNFVIIKGATA